MYQADFTSFIFYADDVAEVTQIPEHEGDFSLSKLQNISVDTTHSMIRERQRKSQPADQKLGT